MRRIVASAAAMLIGTMPAWAVPISQLPNAPGVSLTDAVAAESTSCNGGDCRETIQQILNFILANTNTFTQPQTSLNATPPAFNTDYGQLTGQIGSNSAHIIYNSACGGCTTADAVRGVAISPNGAGVTSVNGVASYVENQNPTSASSNTANAVGLFSVITSGTNNANNWGINTNVEDSGYSGVNLYNEFDFNIGNSQTMLNGLIIQGASSAKPTLANAVVIGNLNLSYAISGSGLSVPWSAAFVTANDAAIYGLQIGLAGGVCVNNSCPANLNSQFIGMASTDSSGAISYGYFYNSPYGIAFSSSVIPANDSSASFGSPSRNWYEMWTNRLTLKPNTSGGLPGCSYTYLGELAFVTDSQSTQIETNLQGGGAFHVPVFCDGAEWVVL